MNSPLLSIFQNLREKFKNVVGSWLLTYFDYKLVSITVQCSILEKNQLRAAMRTSVPSALSRGSESSTACSAGYQQRNPRGTYWCGPHRNAGRGSQSRTILLFALLPFFPFPSFTRFSLSYISRNRNILSLLSYIPTPPNFRRFEYF